MLSIPKDGFATELNKQLCWVFLNSNAVNSEVGLKGIYFFYCSLSVLLKQTSLLAQTLHRPLSLLLEPGNRRSSSLTLLIGPREIPLVGISLFILQLNLHYPLPWSWIACVPSILIRNLNLTPVTVRVPRTQATVSLVWAGPSPLVADRIKEASLVGISHFTIGTSLPLTWIMPYNILYNWCVNPILPVLNQFLNSG